MWSVICVLAKILAATFFNYLKLSNSLSAISYFSAVSMTIIRQAWVLCSVSARGASCHHLTSKKNYNLREDREFLLLEMTKRKKDKDIPLLEGQRTLVGFFSPPAKRVPVTESVLPASLDGGARGARA